MDQPGALADDHPSDVWEAVQAARDLVEQADRVTVLTGAGISTDSGIPDFRGPDGVWTKNPKAEAASTMQTFLSDPAARTACWERIPSLFASAEPNRGHRALCSFGQTGKLKLLVTQNVDGLHGAAGHPDEEVVEVHGSHARVQCLYCFTKHPMRKLLDEYQPSLGCDGQLAWDPRCPRCCGLLKPDVVLFGEAMPEGVLERSFTAARECDLLLCVGTTLSVMPINKMVANAKDSGARVAILNGSPTEMDRHADVVVRAPISAVLPEILGCAADPADADLPGDGAEPTDASADGPPWTYRGFGPWLDDQKLRADMDRVCAEAWMGGMMPDWPPAIYHGSSNPMFMRVGV